MDGILLIALVVAIGGMAATAIAALALRRRDGAPVTLQYLLTQTQKLANERDAEAQARRDAEKREADCNRKLGTAQALAEMAVAKGWIGHTTADPVVLREWLMDHFSKGELVLLAQDFGVDGTIDEASPASEYTAQLIRSLDARGKLPVFIARVIHDRPGVPFLDRHK